MPFPNRRVPLQDSFMFSPTSICKNEKERESLPSVSQPCAGPGRDRLHFGFPLTERGEGLCYSFTKMTTHLLPSLQYTCRVFILQCTCKCMFTTPFCTVLQLYVDDHTPFTKLTVYMPCLYNTMYMLMYVYYTFLYF